MNDSAKQKIIAIVGPTASGKTGLSIDLAKKWSGEVISADSRQVYIGLDIGTEKITKEEMRGVTHHLIDVCEPTDTFTVKDFKNLSEGSVNEIASRLHIPFIVGGTGFYVDALIYDQELPEVPPNENLRRELEPKDASELFALLQQRDPRRAEKIDPYNKRRLVRALEIVASLGKVPEENYSESTYDPLIIGIETDDEVLKDRIATRLEFTLQKGLLEEIESLKKRLPEERLNEFGLEYRIGLQFLNAAITESEMKEKMKTELWQYAKRQKTWFKRNKDILWFRLDQKIEIEKQVEEFLK